MRRRSRCALWCALSAALTACAGGGENPLTNTGVVPVASVRVTTPAATLEVGSTAQLTVTAMDGSGTPLSGRPVSWATSSDAILTVSTSGLARGVSPGRATATATVEGRSGSVELTVVAPPAIAVSGSTVSFSATAGAANPASQSVNVTNAGGGTLSGLTATVSYTATQPTGWLSATLSATTAPSTLTLAATTGSLAAGTYTATVTIASSLTGVASQTIAISFSVVTPAPAPVASVTVAPATASVVVGQTTQLAATTRDAAGSVLTGRAVSWSSSSTAIATVSMTGVVTGVAVGSATITATSEGKSGTAAVTVTPVPVASVEVSPATASVVAGATVQLTATPRDAAGSALTGRAVTWTTSNAAAATVSQSGLVTGVAAGTATITATSEGKSGTAAITVTAAAPQIAAGSIVYIKDGNVWLSDPSGSVKRQVTTDGRYRSPSMADDGTIGVLRDPTTNTAVGTEFVRLSPTGAVLGKITWTFGNGLHRAALSPDGLSFAYIYTAVCAYRTGGTRPCLRLAFTPVDHYEEVEYTGTFDSWDYVGVAWQTNQRLVITGGYLGSALGYSAAEIYVRPTGVNVAQHDPNRLPGGDYKIYSAALTRDGQRMVTHRRRFLGYESDGFTEILGPDEVAVYKYVGPEEYQLELNAASSGAPSGPTASTDGKAWVFGDQRGIVVNVFGSSEFRVIDPNGREPSWGAYVLR